jgi:archaeosine synthase
MTEIVLKGGDELFFHEDVIRFYNRVMNEWDLNSKNIALLLGCSLHKPYSHSFMHQKIIAMIKKHELDKDIQQYIIGEPLAVCPREWEELYPAAHYNFPPEKMGKTGREIFVSRLKKFFERAVNHYTVFVCFAPNHHKGIVLEASEDIFEPMVIPYNVYKLPTLLDTLKRLSGDSY